MLITCVLVAVGCKNAKKEGPLADCSAAIGSCDSPQAMHCGIQLSCEKRQLEVKCTPPAPGAKVMECQCVENSVLGKAVQLENPPSGDVKALASTACGWK